MISCWFYFQGATFDENDEKSFYDSESEEKKVQVEAKPYIMDPDHRLLLRNTKPLLQSRNTAVSLQLFNLTLILFQSLTSTRVSDKKLKLNQHFFKPGRSYMYEVVAVHKCLVGK